MAYYLNIDIPLHNKKPVAMGTKSYMKQGNFLISQSIKI